MRTKNASKNPFITAALLMALSASQAFAVETTAHHPGPMSVEEARNLADNDPANAKLKFQYAEALRHAGKTAEAMREYVQVTEMDPSNYVAYHQIALGSPDQKTLTESIKRLSHLMSDKPRELMLRVALSELLECQGQYFQASKVLVELVFENAVPPKFTAKVNNRIRYLQTKARGEHAVRKTQDVHAKTDSVPPLPLPEENLSRGLSASRLEKGQEVDGFGHSVLQH
jgi:tetratricopeptide (TPR) repeat protein